MSEFKCKWNYITERAPHKGGAWERLVRTIKQPMRTVLKSQKWTRSELQTLLCKVENIVNNRPLSYVSENTTEELVLTPYNFLVPNSFVKASNLSSMDLSQVLKRRDKILRNFFRRWKCEFLLQNCVTGLKNNEDRLQVGDIVIVDDDRRREYWPLAKVLQLLPGRDGITRSVLILLKGKKTRRGINRLYLLERGGSVKNN